MCVRCVSVYVSVCCNKASPLAIRCHYHGPIVPYPSLKTIRHLDGPESISEKIQRKQTGRPLTTWTLLACSFCACFVRYTTLIQASVYVTKWFDNVPLSLLCVHVSRSIRFVTDRSMIQANILLVDGTDDVLMLMLFHTQAHCSHQCNVYTCPYICPIHIQ